MSVNFSHIIEKKTVVIILASAAVAAFGLTFHFFGSSAVVPEPSRQFGFFSLLPVAVIDRIYQILDGERLIWKPMPMFLILWMFYFWVSFFVYFILRKQKQHAV